MLALYFIFCKAALKFMHYYNIKVNYSVFKLALGSNFFTAEKLQPILSFTLYIGHITVPLPVGFGKEQKIDIQFQSNNPKFLSFSISK